jgi:propionyl-CoA carboxylase alpha chain
VKLKGWAVESRVYAEDPYRKFLPSTGRLTRYRPPEEHSAGGVTLRNDTGVYEGGEISIYYDPMIAKLVTHAPTREQAIVAQADALDAFVIDGIRHNIPFLAAVMAHPRWRAGKLSTGFIAEEFPDGFHPHEPEGERAKVLAVVAVAIDHVLGQRKRKISGQMGGKSVTRDSLRTVSFGDKTYTVEVGSDHLRFGDGEHGDRLPAVNSLTLSYRVGRGASGNIPAQTVIIAPRWKPGEPLWTGTVDGHAVAVQVRNLPNGFALAYRGVETKAYVYTEREAGYAQLMPVKKAPDTGKHVLCPMPGLVISIAVKEGQEVKAGETVAVVEAMKMENVLRAEIDGTVKKINAKPGDSLAVDAVIVEFA